MFVNIHAYIYMQMFTYITYILAYVHSVVFESRDRWKRILVSANRLVPQSSSNDEYTVLYVWKYLHVYLEFGVAVRVHRFILAEHEAHHPERQI